MSSLLVREMTIARSRAAARPDRGARYRSSWIDISRISDIVKRKDRSEHRA
jgi:hypothetical protein